MDFGLDQISSPKSRCTHPGMTPDEQFEADLDEVEREMASDDLRDEPALWPLPEGAREHTLRKPCAACGTTEGYIRSVNQQDVARCCRCNAYQYNAPRTETGEPTRHVRTRGTLKPSLRARVVLRGNNRCELCGRSGTEKALHVGHLLSMQDGIKLGLTEAELTTEENLALMCDECNLGLGSMSVPLVVVYRILRARTRGA